MMKIDGMCFCLQMFLTPNIRYELSNNCELTFGDVTVCYELSVADAENDGSDTEPDSSASSPMMFPSTEPISDSMVRQQQCSSIFEHLHMKACHSQMSDYVFVGVFESHHLAWMEVFNRAELKPSATVLSLLGLIRIVQSYMGEGLAIAKHAIPSLLHFSLSSWPMVTHYSCSGSAITMATCVCICVCDEAIFLLDGRKITWVLLTSLSCNCKVPFLCHVWSTANTDSILCGC